MKQQDFSFNPTEMLELGKKIATGIRDHDKGVLQQFKTWITTLPVVELMSQKLRDMFSHLSDFTSMLLDGFGGFALPKSIEDARGMAEPPAFLSKFKPHLLLFLAECKTRAVAFWVSGIVSLAVLMPRHKGPERQAFQARLDGYAGQKARGVQFHAAMGSMRNGRAGGDKVSAAAMKTLEKLENDDDPEVVLAAKAGILVLKVDGKLDDLKEAVADKMCVPTLELSLPLSISPLLTISPPSFAPHSEDVKDKVDDIKDAVEDKVDNIKDAVEGKVDNVKEKMGDAKDAVGKKAKKANNAAKKIFSGNDLLGKKGGGGKKKKGKKGK